LILMAWILYYPLMYMMVAGLRLSALWSKKSANWVRGRKNWQQQLADLPVKKGHRVWFHVSSLGEFEQARPVMEELKRADPGIEIILTFFSPSGYLIRKDYPYAIVRYLPVDLPGNAMKWVSGVRPDIAVFVKYDLWPGYLRALHLLDIPCILISAHWTPGGIFTSRSLPPTRQLLRSFRQIFLQKGEDLDYFRSKGFNNLSIAGDTRIDRSLQLPGEVADKIPGWLLQAPPFDLVAGSTWPRDEKVLVKAITTLHLKVLIAPHDIAEENIQRIMKWLPVPAARLSHLSTADNLPEVVVVDSIGLLSVLYAVGKIAYIGGGFGAGIHNTLEPMAHGKPVIFGPAYQKFPEAVDMVRAKSAFTIRDEDGLMSVIQALQPGEAAATAGKRALDYLLNNAGASDKVANYILESLPCRDKS
jgi:3-deoxy-D-manno-octulosonic-acid transferase